VGGTFSVRVSIGNVIANRVDFIMGERCCVLLGDPKDKEWNEKEDE
jgi:hypothetical protein